MSLSILGKREPQRLLGAGLTDRSGDADHFTLKARPRRSRERAQRGEHVRHDKQRRVARQLGPAACGHDGKSGLRSERRGDEIMTVAVVTLNGEECVARRQRAAVDRDSANRLRQRACALRAGRRRHGVDGPQSAFRHAASSLSAAATAS